MNRGSLTACCSALWTTNLIVRVETQATRHYSISSISDDLVSKFCYLYACSPLLLDRVTAWELLHVKCCFSFCKEHAICDISPNDNHHLEKWKVSMTVPMTTAWTKPVNQQIKVLKPVKLNGCSVFTHRPVNSCFKPMYWQLDKLNGNTRITSVFNMFMK